MRRELLELICCPICGSTLRPAGDDPAGLSPAAEDELWDGVLVCSGSGHEFPIANGIPHLYLDDETWRPKKVEAQGWVKMFKAQGIYDPGPDPVDLRLPYIEDPDWIEIAGAFDLALDWLELSGNERILDLGAGRGWAAKHFAARGCQVVALDIVPDENIGLGRAYVLMEQAQVKFELLIADGEKLPLLADRFDIVFSCATLHHAADLPAMMRNIGRVLKPGGQLCAIREPCRSIWRDEKRTLKRVAAEELAAGINESLPTLGDYVAALDAAQMTIAHALPSDRYQGEFTDWPMTAQVMGAAWGGVDLARLSTSLNGVARFLARRSMALLRGAGKPPVYEYVGDSASQAQADILTWCGGELFLLARKD
ncbi:MAG: methyltransferase domain-containing protein [Chloroflexota bacterium]|nr:MAG: methyltransferase domain-containing protein [Chloroflexota bacterium]